MSPSRFELYSQDLQVTLSSLQQKITHIERSGQRAEKILSHIHEALLLIDFQGTIIESNQAAVNLFQIPSKELTPSSFWDHFEDGFFGFSMRELLEKKSEKKHLILTLMHEGGSKQVEVTTALMPQEGIILIVRDRSEIERLEKSLQESQQLKALGEMAATLAHEIRNPLGGIKGFASLLLEDLAQLPKQKQMVESILEGTHLLNSLVTHVLEYAKPCQLHFTSLQAKELLHKQLLYLSPKDRNRIVIKCPVDFLFIADEMHFTRALLNLIQNGLEASGSRKKLFIIADSKGTITIRDQGSGIAEEDFDKIRTPFFTTKTKGTGLGLSEVHKILKAHSFPYEIASSSKGTTVTIFLRGTKNDHS